MASLRACMLALLVLTTSPRDGRVVGKSQSENIPTENDPLHGYVSINPEVEDLANIALDVEAMHAELTRHSDLGIERGYNIYRFGGFSRSVCTVNLFNGLPEDIPVGTVFAGLGEGGQPVTAVSEMAYGKGTKQIRLLYNQDVPCHVGGLPEEKQQREGCFASPGVFKIGDAMEEHDFSYDMVNDNQNERTIHAMSYNAGRKFKHNGHGAYFHDFQKFVDYFGEPDFADRMITALRERQSYNFIEGSFDFSKSNDIARGDFMRYFASYLTVGLFVIAELERSLEECADHCKQDDCHHQAIHALDGAVAYYTGSVQAEDGNGNLLYGLANDMCQLFKTCGPRGGETVGTAKVNYDIFEEFKEMRENIDNDMCVDATKNKEAIVKHIFVPMVQGFIFSVYRLHNKGNWGDHYRTESAAPFSAAVLPLLGYCKMEEAKKLQLNFSPGNVEITENLRAVERHIHQHLECMGMCCHEVGGLWDPQSNTYYHNAEPCVDTMDRCFPDPEPMVTEKKSRTGLWIFLGIACVLIGYLYRRRWKEMKRRKRAAAEGRKLDEEDDDISLDSEDEMHAFT